MTVLLAPEKVSAAMGLAELTVEQQQAWLAGLDDQILVEVARKEWWYVARPEQMLPPGGDWAIWLILAGRGWGKTRAGGETLVDWILASPYDIDGFPTEWLIVAETLQDGRKINARGPSGIINALRRRLIPYNYAAWPTPTITLGTGQIIHIQGADGDVGRGLNLAGAWLDELCKWPYPTESWTEGLAPALRARTPGNAKPRVVVTTTPKPIRLLVDWTTRRDGSVHLTRGSTFDNAINLSSSAVEEFKRLYGNSRIGRQELYAELLTDIEGALFSSRWLDDARVKVAPELSFTVVSIDPAVSATETSDETGLVAVGRGLDGEDYVLADRSAKVVGFDAALRAWQLFIDIEADQMIYEDNQGMDWVRDVLVDAWKRLQEQGKVGGGDAPVRAVRAMRGKRLRAEPVAARYEQGRVHHVGRLPILETQMTEWEPESGSSPDRLDALVHGITALRGRERKAAVVVNPATLRTGAAPAPELGPNAPAGAAAPAPLLSPAELAAQLAGELAAVVRPPRPPRRSMSSVRIPR